MLSVMATIARYKTKMFELNYKHRSLLFTMIQRLLIQGIESGQEWLSTCLSASIKATHTHTQDTSFEQPPLQKQNNRWGGGGGWKRE